MVNIICGWWPVRCGCSPVDCYRSYFVPQASISYKIAGALVSADCEVVDFVAAPDGHLILPLVLLSIALSASVAI